MNADLRAALSRHQDLGGVCTVCPETWPCDAPRALAALDAAEQENVALRAVEAAARAALPATKYAEDVWQSGGLASPHKPLKAALAALDATRVEP